MAKLTLSTPMLRGKVTITDEEGQSEGTFTCRCNGFDEVDIKAPTIEQALMTFMANMPTMKRSAEWKARATATAAIRAERMKKISTKYHATKKREQQNGQVASVTS